MNKQRQSPDDVLRRMLATPPQPHVEAKKKPAKPPRQAKPKANK